MEAFKAIKEGADANAANRSPPLPDTPFLDPEHVFKGYSNPASSSD